MNKVISINLNGRAYQVEEAGYEKLRKYLDHAADRLGNNPDKSEIMADFEQAIADKCETFLGRNKSVVENKEIEQIIQEMGTVSDIAEEDNKEDDKKSENAAPKRLYLIREGAWISGVCAGLAVFFNIDVTLVRIAFIILTILTHGAWILVYFIMAIIVPVAVTPEEKASARGETFNANELISRAKEKYAQFGDEQYWKSQKKNWKKWAAEHKQNWEKEWRKKSPSIIQTGAKIGGIGLAIIAIVIAAISLLWIFSIISLIATGALFGFIFVGMPIWVVVLIITFAYHLIVLPLRALIRPTPRYDDTHYYHPDDGWFGLWDAFMWIAFLVLIGWLIWRFIPQSHTAWQSVTSWFQAHFQR